jgi:hypothetical protein
MGSRGYLVLVGCSGDQKVRRPKRGHMGEQGPILGVWSEALAIIRRYPSAVVVPGAVLGALAEAPAYLIADRLLAQLMTYLAAAFAYYLYLAYAEQLTTDYERGEDRIAWRSGLARLIEAASFVPRVLVAALITVSLTSAAAALLVVPGVWLYTRWSLSVPVICKEDVGAVGSLKRSSALVRGRFWFVLGTATLAYVAEEASIHAGALAAGSITGSHSWGEWVGGSIVAALAIPLAALTTSVAYSRLTKDTGPSQGT